MITLDKPYLQFLEQLQARILQRVDNSSALPSNAQDGDAADVVAVAATQASETLIAALVRSLAEQEHRALQNMVGD
jgi:hypothetical protein